LIIITNLFLIFCPFSSLLEIRIKTTSQSRLSNIKVTSLTDIARISVLRKKNVLKTVQAFLTEPQKLKEG